jgi:hypothetical protein
MKTEFYNIGDDDWGILMVYDYDYRDFDRIWSMLLAFGLPDYKVQGAMSVLSRPDSGMTLTIPSDLMSVLFISEATSDEEWFDTLIHELKHVVEHISEFYQVEPTSEVAAYLQGEIGRQMFPMIMRKMCKRKEEER